MNDTVKQTEAQTAAAKAVTDANELLTTANNEANVAYDKTVGQPLKNEDGSAVLDEKGDPVLIQARQIEGDDDKSKESTTEQEKEKAAPKFDTRTADQIEGFLKDAKLDPAVVAKVVSSEGGKVTPEILKALEETHGAAVASLIVDKMAALHESTIAVAEAADKETFDQVAKAFEGVTTQTGEETFNELRDWTKKNLSKEDVAGLQELLQQGGMARRLAIDTMIDTFNSSEGHTQKAELMQGEGLADTGVQGIDRSTYDRELRALQAKGYDYATSPEIKQLRTRREKSMRRGL